MTKTYTLQTLCKQWNK